MTFDDGPNEPYCGTRTARLGSAGHVIGLHGYTPGWPSASPAPARC
ncbi:hypothetical protein JOF29_003623 [Kribbella aluminosa]|uniref:NodB homology domain-containing protein n=1 Tax=Kribbella aluminosa TaxID=416017 RepID=A0ABS4ULS1_9ACTN|nr:hypothetical protein [Kribbella aluminosa]MBP2352540.1 hypothetical protein [Kribbella aluminosa]